MILLSASGTYSEEPDMVWFLSIPVQPALQIRESTMLRIIVTGNVYEDQRLGDQVGGFLDVTIDP
jgi:hypothetical protein